VIGRWSELESSQRMCFDEYTYLELLLKVCR
jgi:hypothetical protein